MADTIARQRDIGKPVLARIGKLIPAGGAFRGSNSASTVPASGFPEAGSHQRNPDCRRSILSGPTRKGWRRPCFLIWIVRNPRVHRVSVALVDHAVKVTGSDFAAATRCPGEIDDLVTFMQGNPESGP